MALMALRLTWNSVRRWSRRAGPRWLQLAFLFWLANPLWLVAASPKNPNFLIQHWLAGNGIPENTAYSVAQTPDGFIWVGSTDGLLRFDGRNFERASQLLAKPRLAKQTVSLLMDETGRLWVGVDFGILLHDEQGDWLDLAPTNATLRSVAVTADGQTFVGGTLGQVYHLDRKQLQAVAPPPGLTASGVFCVRDKVDGGLWLANRGFIERRTKSGWERMTADTNIPSAVVAGAAHGGGLWVYGDGRLRRYRTGSPAQAVTVPRVEQPRQIMEDSQGRVWIASNSSGLVCLNPDGTVQYLNATNGLTHNSVWGIIEDREGNFWLGSSVGGLQCFRDRFFKSIGVDDGLPDRIVRTIAATGPASVLVGTHGGSVARIEAGRVVWTHSIAKDARTRYVWSVLHDREQRDWVGTYGHGLFVTENGVERDFPLPAEMEPAIYALLEDSAGRIWVGSIAGAGVIEGGQFHTLAPQLSNACVRCFAEEPRTGAMWIGTLEHGLFRLQGTNLMHWGISSGLPDNRICSLTFDPEGCLWAGLFNHGLVGLKEGKIVACLDARQGLPALTIAAMLNDHLGCFWLGTDQGILRVSQADLRRAAAGGPAKLKFETFNEGDGLDNAECAEGYQPTAMRDARGELWFATLNGVVHVAPDRLRINTNRPPVKIEKVVFRDRAGGQHILTGPVERVVLPAGSTELEVVCAALSFAVPEKVQYAFNLEGSNTNWVNQGHERVISFRSLSHGKYRLHVQAANNDGRWNEAGATLAITMEPFVWQTWWCQVLVVLVLLFLGGAVVGQRQRARFMQQQALLMKERVLAREKARLASILESTSDLVSFASPNGLVIYLNPAGRRMVGLGEQEDATRLRLQSFFPAAASDHQLETAIAQAVQHGTWTGQAVLRTLAGGSLPVSQVIVAHKNAANQLEFLSTIIRDVSERQRQEDELQRREQYFRSLIEHASDSITVINKHAVVTYQSPSGVRLLGYPAEAMLGRNLLELAHPEDLVKSRAALECCLEKLNQPVSLTVRLRHRDGAWRTVEAVGSSIVAQSGEIEVIVNSRDVTVSLRMEEELRQSQKMEAIGQLAGGVAHDFNNILSSMQLQAELIGMLDDLPTEAREGLQQISADTRRAADLTRRMLLFSRRQVMQTRILDLGEVVTGMVKMLRRIIREDIQLQIDLHAAPLWTRADAGMLEQVLMNLAVNASDAMPQGGRLWIATTQVVLSEQDTKMHPEGKPGRFVCLSVKDTGTGIPPEYLQRIFEPFFTTKEVGKGTGLGLATVFGVVKQHDGWIQVDNRPGEGVTFHVYLPASSGAVADPMPIEQKRELPRGVGTILLVEDEMAVRQVTRALLERHGYEVLTAANGDEALELWQKQHQVVSLLLTDMVMPGDLSGRKLAERLRSDQPRLKVIFMSGYNAEIAGLDLQSNDLGTFLQKPIGKDELLGTIRRVLLNQPATL